MDSIEGLDEPEVIEVLGEEPPPDVDQTDLFADEPGSAPVAEETVELTVSEPANAPTEADLEAAAEHFAGSIREDDEGAGAHRRG